MKRVEGRGLFPPRVGWVPLGIAAVAVTIMALWAASPQFSTQIIGSVARGNDGNGGGGSGVTGTGGGGTGVNQPGTAVGGGPGTSHGTGGPGASANNPAAYQCAAGRNGGSTAPGVTGNEIHVASTIVTTGEGAGFLGEAVSGMQAAINEANNSGGICGRRVAMSTVNDGWVSTTGQGDIDAYINSGNVFALVGEPDSQGLAAAIDSHDIDRASIPVVGTDGMLADQYQDPWVWPVAASTVTNMHVAVDYAVHVLGAKTFGIVFDTSYKFGREGAAAFESEVKRETGSDIAGYADNTSGNGCKQAYCGIETEGNTDYSSAIHTFNSTCQNVNGSGKPCDVVVMLLEPQPMETWMSSEAQCNCTWYKQLMGGEPLFDDNLGSNCAGECSGMMVWTGYHPAIQPFDSEKAVYTYAQSLKAVCPSCDPHNEFTEGAYLGTKMFIQACMKVGPNLTRQALANELNTDTFDFGLTAPFHYSTSLPHLANISMAVFSDNAPPNGSFNGWTYRNSGFRRDPSPGKDMRSS